MADKEKLEQLTGYINKLSKLTESIYEREIYPVSFFSQAYDITNKIHESLHQIEIAQIELFERQMKEHQIQIQSIQPLKIKTESSRQPTLLTEQPEPLADHNATLAEDKTHTVPVSQDSIENKSASDNKEQQTILSTSTDEKLLSTIEPVNKNIEKKILADLRKAFTLNDRFRLCRELFSSDENLMNQTFSELNHIESYECSVNYIKEHFNWNPEDEVVAEFMAIIEKRFL